MDGSSKTLVIESRSMTLKQLIELVSAGNARLTNTLGTPVVEIEDSKATRRIIISNIIFETDRIKERMSDGREKIYLVSPLRLFRSAVSSAP